MTGLPKPYYEEPGIVIYHGDCREILPLLPDKSADLVLTDPPYGHQNNDGDLIANWEAALGKGPSGPPRPIVGDGPEANELVRFLFMQSKRLLNQGCCCCCCGGGGPDPQFALVSKTSKWYGGDSTPNVIRFPKIIPQAIHHPMEKPVQLVAFFVGIHSLAGETVCDPFMGSGTTLVAAKQLGRKAIGIEIEEKYCEIAVKRLMQEQLPFPESRAKRELAELQTLWDSGHPDRRGIKQGMADWIEQDALDSLGQEEPE